MNFKEAKLGKGARKAVDSCRAILVRSGTETPGSGARYLSSCPSPGFQSQPHTDSRIWLPSAHWLQRSCVHLRLARLPDLPTTFLPLCSSCFLYLEHSAHRFLPDASSL